MPFVVPALAAVGGGSALAGAATVATVTAAGVSAYSSVQQGRAAKKAAAYNMGVANNNAILAQQQSRNDALAAQNNAKWLEYQQVVQTNQARAKQLEAESLRQSSEENLKRRRDDYRRLLSRQRAGFAKAGVVLGGSAIEVLAESATRMELEAQEVVNQTRGAMEAMYYEAELVRAGAQSIGADVYLKQWQGRNSLATGKYKADLLRTDAAMGVQKANSFASSSNLQAFSSVLGGASSAYGDYRRYN